MNWAKKYIICCQVTCYNIYYTCTPEIYTALSSIPAKICVLPLQSFKQSNTQKSNITRFSVLIWRFSSFGHNVRHCPLSPCSRPVLVTAFPRPSTLVTKDDGLFTGSIGRGCGPASSATFLINVRMKCVCERLEPQDSRYYEVEGLKEQFTHFHFCVY
jgi:hypothetical protein